MAYLGIPPSDLDLECDIDGVRVTCKRSSAGVSTSILLRDGHESLVIDAGDGALRDLVDEARKVLPSTLDEAAKTAMGRFVEGIRAVALTHDHFDHVGGLFSLLRFLDMVGRRSPLKVIFPKGSSTVEAFAELFGRGDPRFEVDIVRIEGEGTIEVGGWGIGWVPADHHDLTMEGKVGKRVPSVAYIVSRRGIKVFYTGDTAFGVGIASAAVGCDLAIAEATYPEKDGKPAHMSVAEATSVVSRAKRGWLVHLTGASGRTLDRNVPRK